MRKAALFLFLVPVILPFTCSATAEGQSPAAFLEAVAQSDAAAVQRMLAEDPSLASAKRPNGTSAVTVALFAIRKGEGFTDPAKNEVLQAILARKPQLDIFETAAVGSAEQLEAMLRDDRDAVSRKTRYGWTLLHLAAFGGNAASVQLLIRDGADVNARAGSKFRNTPLQAALLSGQYATARLLLESGADALVRQSGGITPLHEAALLGRADLVQLLLDHGAELNSVADNGLTALGAAIRGHHDDLAASLRSKGAVTEPVRDEESLPKKTPGYVVIEGEVTNPEAIKPYAAKVLGTLAPFHYEFLARAGKTVTLEGEPPKNVIVIAFDTVDDARAWYDSSAYSEIKPVRQKAAKSRMYIVEGVASKE